MSTTRRTLVASLALVLASCGAKTALDVSALDASVALDASDAGAFRTFPCRWFPELPVELPLVDVYSGAVSAELERVAIVGADRGGARDVWLSFVPRATPVLEGAFAVSWPGRTRGLVPRRGGWLAVASSPGERGCDLLWLDATREVERSERIEAAPEGCTLDPVDLDRAILRVGVAPGVLSLQVIELADGTRRELESRAPVESAATRAREGVDLVVVAAGESWQASARPLEGPEASVLWPREGLRGAQLAPDRLLGGALVLTERAGGVELARLRLDGRDLARDPIAGVEGDVDVLDLATNETEALFTLENGSFVAVPVHTGDVRLFPPPPGVVRASRLVMAPGQSVAVQTWVGERSAFLRALVCNR